MGICTFDGLTNVCAGGYNKSQGERQGCPGLVVLCVYWKYSLLDTSDPCQWPGGAFTKPLSNTWGEMGRMRGGGEGRRGETDREWERVSRSTLTHGRPANEAVHLWTWPVQPPSGLNCRAIKSAMEEIPDIHGRACIQVCWCPSISMPYTGEEKKRLNIRRISLAVFLFFGLQHHGHCLQKFYACIHSENWWVGRH